MKKIGVKERETIKQGDVSDKVKSDSGPYVPEEREITK